jgi:hypothetical protein
MSKPLTLREAILSRLKSFEPEYQQLLRLERSAPTTEPPRTEHAAQVVSRR